MFNENSKKKLTFDNTVCSSRSLKNVKTGNFNTIDFLNRLDKSFLLHFEVDTVFVRFC